MGRVAEEVNISIRKRVAAARRIVIKLGTNVLIRDDGAAAVGLLYGLVESAVNVRRQGKELIFVSSGAIGLGAKRLGLATLPSELTLKQACAAVGQSRLMSLYEDAFRNFDVPTAQVLLTEDDFLDPVRYSNLWNTLHTLLQLGVMPIINENDTVSTLELDRPDQLDGVNRVFGDNDKLSALVMTKIDADMLVLLSDVDGLYTMHPSEHGAELVSEVAAVSPELSAYAKIGTGRGRGGMSTKLGAARMVTEAGKIAVIANGRTPGILERVCAGENAGTVFHPAVSPRPVPCIQELRE
jgi:glutamate 5-kinase